MENMDKVILIIGLSIPTLIALIILVKVFFKAKANIETSFRHGNSQVNIKVESQKGEKNKGGENVEKTGSSLREQEEIDSDLDKLMLHRFFTTILCQFTTDNCVFNLYDETIKLGIIKDTEEVASFKKILASRYLHLCLFKVLGEHIKKWIVDLCNEIKTTDLDSKKIPSTFYSISQYITQYKNEAYREGKSIEFKFQDKVFYGIPTKFMARFNDWSDSNMLRVYNMISDVLYSTQNTWFAKTIELLNLFEVIFMMLHDQMDATLIILNGEIARYLETMDDKSS